MATEKDKQKKSDEVEKAESSSTATQEASSSAKTESEMTEVHNTVNSEPMQTTIDNSVASSATESSNKEDIVDNSKEEVKRSKGKKYEPFAYSDLDASTIYSGMNIKKTSPRPFDTNDQLSKILYRETNRLSHVEMKERAAYLTHELVDPFYVKDSLSMAWFDSKQYNDSIQGQHSFEFDLDSAMSRVVDRYSLELPKPKSLGAYLHGVDISQQTMFDMLAGKTSGSSYSNEVADYLTITNDQFRVPMQAGWHTLTRFNPIGHEMVWTIPSIKQVLTTMIPDNQKEFVTIDSRVLKLRRNVMAYADFFRATDGPENENVPLYEFTYKKGVYTPGKKPVKLTGGTNWFNVPEHKYSVVTGSKKGKAYQLDTYNYEDVITTYLKNNGSISPSQSEISTDLRALAIAVSSPSSTRRWSAKTKFDPNTILPAISAGLVDGNYYAFRLLTMLAAVKNEFLISGKIGRRNPEFYKLFANRKQWKAFRNAYNIIKRNFKNVAFFRHWLVDTEVLQNIVNTIKLSTRNVNNIKNNIDMGYASIDSVISLPKDWIDENNQITEMYVNTQFNRDAGKRLAKIVFGSSIPNVENSLPITLIRNLTNEIPKKAYSTSPTGADLNKRDFISSATFAEYEIDVTTVTHLRTKHTFGNQAKPTEFNLNSEKITPFDLPLNHSVSGTNASKVYSPGFYNSASDSTMLLFTNFEKIVKAEQYSEAILEYYEERDSFITSSCKRIKEWSEAIFPIADEYISFIDSIFNDSIENEFFEIDELNRSVRFKPEVAASYYDKEIKFNRYIHNIKRSYIYPVRTKLLLSQADGSFDDSSTITVLVNGQWSRHAHAVNPVDLTGITRALAKNNKTLLAREITTLRNDSIFKDHFLEEEQLFPILNVFRPLGVDMQDFDNMNASAKSAYRLGYRAVDGNIDTSTMNTWYWEYIGYAPLYNTDGVFVQNNPFIDKFALADFISQGSGQRYNVGYAPMSQVDGPDKKNLILSTMIISDPGFDMANVAGTLLTSEVTAWDDSRARYIDGENFLKYRSIVSLTPLEYIHKRYHIDVNTVSSLLSGIVPTNQLTAFLIKDQISRAIAKEFDTCFPPILWETNLKVVPFAFITPYLEEVIPVESYSMKELYDKKNIDLYDIMILKKSE